MSHATHQLRPPGSDGAWYSPARDLTVYTPVAIRKALEEWENPNSPYHSVFGVRAWTDSDVEDICNALAELCSPSGVFEPDNYVEALDKTGFIRVPVHLRLVVMALLGEQILASYWVGIRSATTKRDDEDEFRLMQYDPEVLSAAAQGMARLLKMPAWKRRWYVWWERARKWVVSKLGGGNADT